MGGEEACWLSEVLVLGLGDVRRVIGVVLCHGSCGLVGWQAIRDVRAGSLLRAGKVNAELGRLEQVAQPNLPHHLSPLLG